MDVEELCGEAGLALIGAVERTGMRTALCRKGIHVGCCGRIGSREMGVVDVLAAVVHGGFMGKRQLCRDNRGRWADRS